MSILDKLAHAETSSDLQHHDRWCDVDVLGAAGMAGHPNMAIFRVKYLNDPKELDNAKRLFIRWARCKLRDRNMDRSKASRIGVQALMAWLDDVCHHCSGLKHQPMQGAPVLSDKTCPACRGTGRAVIERGNTGEVIKDIHHLANDTITEIRGKILQKIT